MTLLPGLGDRTGDGLEIHSFAKPLAIEFGENSLEITTDGLGATIFDMPEGLVTEGPATGTDGISWSEF